MQVLTTNKRVVIPSSLHTHSFFASTSITFWFAFRLPSNKFINQLRTAGSVRTYKNPASMVLSVPDVNFRQRSPILFAITVAIPAAARFRLGRWHLATFVVNGTRCASRLFRRHVVRTLFVGRSVFHEHQFDAVDDFHRKAWRITRLSLSPLRTRYKVPMAPIHPHATKCDTPPPLAPSSRQCGREDSRLAL